MPGSPIHFENNSVAATVSGTGLATDQTTSAIIQGTVNWIQSSVTTAGSLTSTIVGTSPGFVGGGDYHLVAGAQEINAGLANLTYLDGTGTTQSAVPTSEFVLPDGVTPRPSDGQLDLGAYELAGSTQADGGTPDSGTPDAGNPDGGPGSGPGGPPGGPPSGGIPDGSTGVQGGCTAGPSAAPWAVVLGTLLVVVALRTWRRR